MTGDLITIKDLVVSYDFTKPTNVKGKIYRGTAHEFQDYAYRLACDLNDLDNLPIYMKLSRSVGRHILEKAFQFVSDSNIDNKGKLFLWKLKQLKQSIEREINMFNFEYDYVLKKNTQIRNLLVESLFKKEISNYSYDLDKWLLNLAGITKQNKLKKKVLFISTLNTALMGMFSDLGWKVFNIDMSQNINKKNTENLKEKPNIKLIRKDFLKNSFKKDFFDLIIIDSYWQFIPLEIESKWLVGLTNLVKKDGGNIVIGTRLLGNESQKWSSINVLGVEHLYFQKFNSQNLLTQKVSQNYFKIIDQLNFKDKLYLKLSI